MFVWHSLAKKDFLTLVQPWRCSLLKKFDDFSNTYCVTLINYSKIRSMLEKQFIGLDLFSGAGGMSLGAELAGISVKYAIEKNTYTAQTYQNNHSKTKVINSDVREIKSIPDNLRKGSTVLFGGAPCQGFSTSNRRTNNRNNSDNWLYKEFVRILRLWKPDWLVFENVTGIIKMESGVFFEEIVSDFKYLGYTCSHGILNAADFGVPQKRNRLFLIGSKHGETIDITPTTNKMVFTVRDALSDLPCLENGANTDILPYSQKADNGYAKAMRSTLTHCTGHLVTKNSEQVIKRYNYIRQGGNWESIPSELMQSYTDPTRCHTGIYHRLREDKPSVVIGNYRKNMLIHPWSNRGLSVREAARLQSFPDDYIFTGSIGFQQQQVANAVPPLLAKKVFELITKRNTGCESGNK
jgi:DNA (cytosine-5)-methyltransferase 1